VCLFVLCPTEIRQKDNCEHAAQNVADNRTDASSWSNLTTRAASACTVRFCPTAPFCCPGATSNGGQTTEPNGAQWAPLAAALPRLVSSSLSLLPPVRSLAFPSAACLCLCWRLKDRTSEKRRRQKGGRAERERERERGERGGRRDALSVRDDAWDAAGPGVCSQLTVWLWRVL
jgi:hypothetical protein